MIVKSTLNLIISSAKDKSSPGCFKQIFSELQALNSLPIVDLGNMDMSGLNFFPTNKNDDGQVADIVNEVVEPRGTVPSMSTSSSQMNILGGSSISIIKKKTAANLDQLFKSGHIYYENNSSLSQDHCHNLLMNNSALCGIALTKVKMKDFRSVNKGVKQHGSNLNPK